MGERDIKMGWLIGPWLAKQSRDARRAWPRLLSQFHIWYNRAAKGRIGNGCKYLLEHQSCDHRVRPNRGRYPFVHLSFLSSPT